MNDFDDIRPFNDSEVPAALARLIADSEMMNLLLSRQFPVLTKILPGVFSLLARPLLRRSLRKLTKGVSTISDFQHHMTTRLVGVLESSTDSYQFAGLDCLDPKRAYLFMSNHRDIALDPAIICLGLTSAGRNTVRIAIGDNLLSKPFASDLMRINRSFIVKRSVSGRREKLEALKNLSRYIRHSLSQEAVSIWIAQAEGRAKDGKDRTETALLKMLALSRDPEQSFAESTGELNVIPVSISYEYDPCDSDKACELYAQQNGMTYTKDPFEDLDSIQKGFVGYKGRIQVTFGEPVADKYETADLLATEIDRQIHLNYQLFPSNIIAWQMHSESVDTSVLVNLESQWPDEDWTLARHRFETRINSMPKDHQPIAVAAYAAPVDSQLHHFAQSQRL
jgi:1-acyl-sn-glycerol-3-phosphate acyltransferase|tara:strand:+ start:615 stop:1796 length:1182 start_codon:yes stop_codon:yes gene_type:complete